MTTRFRKSLWLAALVGAVFLGTATHARANIELDLQDGNGAITKVNLASNDGPATFSGTVGNFKISIAFGDSNSPGTINALTEQGSIKITNTDGSNSHTLHISVSAQGFNSPQSPPPLNILDTVSGSLVSGSVKGDFTGYANASNSLETLTSGASGFAGQKLSFNVSGSSVSFSQDGAVGGFSPNGSTYSLSVFGNFDLGAGTSITLTGGNVQAVLPVPAGMVLALSGLPLLGLPLLRRRRKLA